MENESNKIPLEDHEFEKDCWICFGTEEDDPVADWVQPCKCKGTSKWVHQDCLQRWIDAKLKNSATTQVRCSQCQTEYVIEFPDMGVVIDILDMVDNVIDKCCPFLAGVTVMGAIYWTALTYGAFTVLQVVGYKEGFALMKQTNRLVLLVGLPAIPVALIVGKLIRWEDIVLNFIRRHLVNVPLIKYILPFRIDVRPSLPISYAREEPPFSDLTSAARVLGGALMLPTIAVLFEKICFSSKKPNFYQIVLGGLTFIVIKGALSIYHKQQRYVRQCEQKILNYPDSSNQQTDD